MEYIGSLKYLSIIIEIYEVVEGRKLSKSEFKKIDDILHIIKIQYDFRISVSYVSFPEILEISEKMI